MAVTAQNIIDRALRALQVLGGTESSKADEASDALIAFNAMLDSWSNEGLISYQLNEYSFPLVIGKSSYTLGPGGDINQIRFLDITQAYIQDTGFNNYLMDIRTRDWWNFIGNRGPNITSQIPTVLFYDTQYPLSVVNIFPAPLIAYTCFIDGQLNEPNFAQLTTVLSMPPGYERAYVSNLAMELVLLGFETTLNAQQLSMLASVASESKANIKSTNITENVASYDDALVSRSMATYNIFRNSWGG